MEEMGKGRVDAGDKQDGLKPKDRQKLPRFLKTGVMAVALLGVLSQVRCTVISAGEDNKSKGQDEPTSTPINRETNPTEPAKDQGYEAVVSEPVIKLEIDNPQDADGAWFAPMPESEGSKRALLKLAEITGGISDEEMERLTAIMYLEAGEPADYQQSLVWRGILDDSGLRIGAVLAHFKGDGWKSRAEAFRSSGG